MSNSTADRFVRRIPEGDDRERLTCTDCGFVAYENPKVVVGSIVETGDGILLCRRAIHPRRGYWTIPAGYMEMGETVEEGAQREAWEEARARASPSTASSRSIRLQGSARFRSSSVPAWPNLDSRPAPKAWRSLPYRGPTFPGTTWPSPRSAGRWRRGRRSRSQARPC